MADQAEAAFLRVYINTLQTQPVTYTDDYQQPPQNSLKRVPVLHIALPKPPPRKQAHSSAPLTLTFKSLKPPASYTLAVQPTDTVAAVKAQLAAQPALAHATISLLLKGKALADAKLIREYPIKDGDTVNLILKSLASPATPASSASTMAEPDSKSSATLASPAPTHPRRHQRIPSVVLSPSPSADTPTSDKDITLTLDAATETGGSPQLQELSTYHATIAQPEFWARLLAFLRSEHKSDADAQLAFEDFLLASKGTLTASEIARIRDHVGVIGMAGT